MGAITRDAAGRTITVGDTIGGVIITGRNDTLTIIGPIHRVSPDRVTALVTNQPTRNGDRVSIPTHRTFLLQRAAERSWIGFRTPDDRLWTVYPYDRPFLFECLTAQARHDASTLRRLYRQRLHPVWDEPAALPAQNGRRRPYAGPPDRRTSSRPSEAP